MLLVINFIFPAQTFSQKLWTLEDCIKYALENNIQIKQQRLSLEMQKDAVLQSKAALLPNVNASASHGYNYGKSIDRFTNTFASQKVQFDNFYLSGNLTVFNGFQLLNTLAKNKLELQAGKYDVEKIQNDISLNLASAYLNILFNQELYSIAQEQKSITSQQVARTKKLVDAGTMAKGNLLSLEAQLASEELQEVSMKNNLELSILQLVQMLDLSPEEKFEIVRPNFVVPESINLETGPGAIVKLAMMTQPQIKSAELKVLSSLKDLNIARGAYAPTITLQGSYGTGFSGASERLKGLKVMGFDTIGYTAQLPPLPVVSVIPSYIYEYEKIPFNDQINNNVNKSIGLYLSIPLFNGLQVRTANSRAKIAIENARLNLVLQQNTLTKDIHSSFADAMAAIQKYNAAKKSVEAMRENFGYTEQKFNVGMLNFVDFNEAKKNLAKSESELLQAKFEFVFKKTVLDFYMGRPINLN